MQAVIGAQSTRSADARAARGPCDPGRTSNSWVPARTGTWNTAAMHRLGIVAIVLAFALCADAHEPRATARAPSDAANLFVEIPLDRYSTGVVFPFGGSHHAVPGVVAVNAAPYYCAPHRRTFASRAGFVAHLRSTHGLDERDIPRTVLVEHGQVRYIGD